MMRPLAQGDGDAEHPVISLSIGASCNFGWRPEPLPAGAGAGAEGGRNRSVLLESVRPLVASFRSNWSAKWVSKIATGKMSHELPQGDIAIFGGVSRMMEHAVKAVHSAASAPPALQHPHPLGGGRLNFTFRHAPADGDINVHTRR
jgi:hypothetical protein